MKKLGDVIKDLKPTAIIGKTSSINVIIRSRLTFLQLLVKRICISEMTLGGAHVISELSLEFQDMKVDIVLYCHYIVF